MRGRRKLLGRGRLGYICRKGGSQVAQVHGSHIQGPAICMWEEAGLGWAGAGAEAQDCALETGLEAEGHQGSKTGLGGWTPSPLLASSTPEAGRAGVSPALAHRPHTCTAIPLHTGGQPHPTAIVIPPRYICHTFMTTGRARGAHSIPKPPKTWRGVQCTCCDGCRGEATGASSIAQWRVCSGRSGRRGSCRRLGWAGSQGLEGTCPAHRPWCVFAPQHHGGLCLQAGGHMCGVTPVVSVLVCLLRPIKKPALRLRDSLVPGAVGG